MTISPLGGATATSAVTSSSRTHHDPFDSVASLLGTSADDLRTQVKNGSSLLQIAEDKGVSADDLYQALKDGAPSDLQQSARLDDVVRQIASASGASAVRGPGGHGGPPPGPPPGGGPQGAGSSQESLLSTLSDLLDTDEDDLATQLASGTSLTDLLQAHGVSLQDLATALQDKVGTAPVGLQVDTSA